MNERDALLAAILANPDEDTPRLMFADWLMDSGDADRGNFIRLQIEAARAEPFGPVARARAAEAQRVYENRRSDWEPHLRGGRATNWSYTRGFVEHVRVDASNFHELAPAMFAVEPIRAVQPVRTPLVGSLSWFFETPELARVACLDLSALDHSPVEIQYLGENPRLATLTDLSLGTRPILPPWLNGLLTGPGLPALAGLDLRELSHLGVCLSDALPRLDHRMLLRLNLNRVVFSSDQIQRTLASRCLREVEELRLGWGLPDPSALTLLDLGWVIPWNHLRLLDLTGQGVGSAGVDEIVKELTRRKEPAPLRWLGLANNGIGSDGFRRLIDSDPAKVNLFYLNVSGNNLSASQRTALEARFGKEAIDTTRPA